MDILTANQITTTDFALIIQEINTKYKKLKLKLKETIVETARSQAEEILANDNDDDDDMGNPEELCRKLAELRLKYNSINIKKQKEIDTIMNEYCACILNNMRKENTLSYDDRIRLEVYDKYIGNCNGLQEWHSWHPNEKWHHSVTKNKPEKYCTGTLASPQEFFTSFRYILCRRMNEQRQAAEWAKLAKNNK